MTPPYRPAFKSLKAWQPLFEAAMTPVARMKASSLTTGMQHLTKPMP